MTTAVQSLCDNYALVETRTSNHETAAQRSAQEAFSAGVFGDEDTPQRLGDEGTLRLQVPLEAGQIVVQVD